MLIQALNDARQSASERPEDVQAYIDQGKAYLALGHADLALEQADRALELNPQAAIANFVKVQAYLLADKEDEAIDLAVKTLADSSNEFKQGARGGLVGTLVGLELHRDDLDAAERILFEYQPSLPNIINTEPASNFETIQAPPHFIQDLAIIYHASGRQSQAAGLRQHIAFLDEGFLKAPGEELGAIDHYLLASVGFGVLEDDQVMDHLEAAWDGGFKMGWRYNYQQHPTLWPYRNHPRYRALIARIESEVSHLQGVEVK
jgi:tetratricopeptide (TPR) repeat protein